MQISNKEFNKNFFRDNIFPKGKAVFTFCKIKTPEAIALQEKICKLAKEGTWEKYQQAVKELHSKFKVREIVIDNLVMRVGRTILARILKGDFTYTGEINYCALGTGQTASTTSETRLVQELYRKQVSSKAYSTYHTYVSTFFTAGECSGTYKEIAHIIDGTATINTGQMWSRIADPETAELPITKSSQESLTVDYNIVL